MYLHRLRDMGGGKFIFFTAIVPLMVEKVSILYDDLVVWMALNNSRGPIKGYDVQFVSDINTSASIISVDANIAVYRPNVTEDFPPTGQPVYVRVGLWAWPQLVVIVMMCVLIR